MGAVLTAFRHGCVSAGDQFGADKDPSTAQDISQLTWDVFKSDLFCPDLLFELARSSRRHFACRSPNETRSTRTGDVLSAHGRRLFAGRRLRNRFLLVLAKATSKLPAMPRATRDPARKSEVSRWAPAWEGCPPNWASSAASLVLSHKMTFFERANVIACWLNVDGVTTIA